ncbi:isoprenylcysteine carboxylmethyltransferase family protein [Stutzerimonas urumqiensis]|uniref:methyltransferase family protein n=1 Tax=Stutzerimonas urumqiensis TaxID=638269 RepID=UPI003BAD6DF7
MRMTVGAVLPPPLVYLFFLGAAYLSDRLVALRFPAGAWGEALGWLLIGGGIALMLWAGLFMLHRRTTVNPYGTPRKLLVDGPFRVSRNPIYLADSLIYGGVALLWGSLWPWLLLPALVLVMQRGVIVHEERLHDQLFGEDYRAYRSRVRRWL